MSFWGDGGGTGVGKGHARAVLRSPDFILSYRAASRELHAESVPARHAV